MAARPPSPNLPRVDRLEPIVVRGLRLRVESQRRKLGEHNLELGNGKNDSSGGDDESIVQQYSRKSKEQMYTDLFNGYMNLTNV